MPVCNILNFKKTGFLKTIKIVNFPNKVRNSDTNKIGKRIRWLSKCLSICAQKKSPPVRRGLFRGVLHL
ncbi:MAG: hypothetical protein C4560_02530 [Nitrospiraceae bacterium]|nr:MAG: hypothetical protein C4560_02530 [Nitrospiraceae bacterium]